MPLEHRSPSLATIKQLYATALHCGYEGCDRDLYVEDQQSGQWVLNSRICHIHARSEHGPRWKSSQTEEENRSEANLILMCPEHASRIDIKGADKIYPPERLFQWKREQIEDHRQRAAGWPLTTRMAEEAQGASFTNVGIAIVGSTVNLGGQGGAPGGGGGGGGAIGPNAHAGHGGPGGNVVDGEWEHPNGVDFSPGVGGGGGGGGSEGDGAAGGNGGGGGEITCFTVATSDLPDTLEIEIGRGGTGGHLPGQHGLRGTDTVLKEVGIDGTVVRQLRGRGGEAGQANDSSDKFGAIVLDDLRDGFQISTLMIANGIETRDGWLYVLGGGLEKLSVSKFPFDAVFNILCVASWLKRGRSGENVIHLGIENPDREEVSSVALTLTDKRPDAGHMQWIQQIGASLTECGTWTFSVRSGDFVLAKIPLNVLQG
jgi:hypothetical protein